MGLKSKCKADWFCLETRLRDSNLSIRSHTLNNGRWGQEYTCPDHQLHLLKLQMIAFLHNDRSTRQLTVKSGSSHNSRRVAELPPIAFLNFFLYWANITRLVSRPAAIPGSKVQALSPVCQHPAAGAAEPHGAVLHSGVAAKQGGVTWGSPNPAAEKMRIISVGETLFKKRQVKTVPYD